MKYLVGQSVDLSHRDKTGKTADDYAREMMTNAKTKEDQVVAKNILDLLS